jgi:hypothetical protein
MYSPRHFGLGAEYHDYNVVKMAEHYMKKENYSSAIKLLEDLLKTPQPSMVNNTVFFILSWYSLIE